ncbi:nickel pincer cofactor biosynthesis protein LarC [Methanofollis aquaemaris]|uniref:Putative nickel insertion protein n=1 Tax=Methanofollis aquaemaris TaxID=126734 RepID=A0A8A3S684_9EURY|nr:nickel pincer cofactor biosynthesis protein LarC [Methanofollis aquaemaris]QSZ67200.1 nickel pincer cofactor biosynthesis protein LarC [Methanofollis aquaemaris]
MRILLFDPFHGAAGDMTIGALLAVGADEVTVRRAMASVVVDPLFSRVKRCGISAVRVETRAGPAHRDLHQVLEIVEGADAPRAAVERAKRVFHRIAEAEESIHGEHAHFHEVGADDAIADVVGACTALETLAVDGVAVMPVALGSGKVMAAHGLIPVPAPATLAVMVASELETRFGVGDGELCTPTGAALMAEFASVRPADLGPARVVGVGYGAGTRDPEKTPNVLRAVLLELARPALADEVDVLETNVDDVTGEVLGHCMDLLFAAGARDVSVLPAVMKKGRAGHLVRVVCRPADVPALTGILARELGTLGVRCIPSVHRSVLERREVSVEAEVRGERRTVHVKVGYLGGTVSSVKAESDEVRAWASSLDVPVRTVARLVEAAAWKRLAGADE